MVSTAYPLESQVPTGIMAHPRLDLLRDLVSALRSKKLNRENFNMTVWATGRIQTSTLGCGYAACAAGMGCSLPSWQEVGFKLAAINRSVNGTPIYAPVFTRSAMRRRHINEGYHGLAEGLSISIHLAEYFFCPDSYRNSNPSPLTVANRIRNWIKMHERRNQ